MERKEEYFRMIDEPNDLDFPNCVLFEPDIYNLSWEFQDTQFPNIDNKYLSGNSETIIEKINRMEESYSNIIHSNISSPTLSNLF
jgi:hypothetical protein